ncbi:MAG TPA: glycerophosphodiester phosphodiesterase [Candidatus Xenobia bacterium]|nr:glycerophosphodiester phosphodiesterase [Candidatus Xenobia bacterium]
MSFPLIIAHRGEPGRRENTLAGFLAGIARGANWIELDVHLTADGQVAVHHDAHLARRALSKLTLEEARALARRRKRIELPTLDEVLETIAGHIGLNVEIKDPRAGRAVVAALARHKAVDRAICSSFHWPAIRELADLRPRVATGILTSGRLRNPAGDFHRAHADAVFQGYKSVQPAQVREVKKAGFGFYVWTVNREADLRRMVELGVDGIITDYPERLVHLRQRLTR